MGLLDVTEDGKIHPEYYVTREVLAYVIYNLVDLLGIEIPSVNGTP